MLLNMSLFRLILVRSFGEKGQSIVEYALVLALVTVVAVGIGVGNLDQKVVSVFNNVAALFGGGGGE